MAVNARAAAIVRVVIHVVLGSAFAHTGAAAWLWERVERDVPWRTGPTWEGVFAFLAIYWAAWVIIDLALRTVSSRGSLGDRGTAESAVAGPIGPSRRTARLGMTIAAGGRALIASCVLVAVQVLMPSMWLAVALAFLLLAMLVNAYLVREPLRRTATAWAWSGAGVALAALLIHPYFVGLPLFAVRLAVVMTVWDALGERLGVTRRVARFVPSLYAGSDFTAAQARVAR